MMHSLSTSIFRSFFIGLFMLYTALPASGQDCSNDTEPPVIVCQDLEFMLPLSGARLLSYTDVTTSITDNCGIDASSIYIIPNNFSGPTTRGVDVYATDLSGNQGTCVANVTVLGRPTTLINNGVFAAAENETINLQASLIDDVTGGPAPGVFIRFTIGTQEKFAQTGLNGIASTQMVLNQPAGSYTLSAETNGGAVIFLNSSDSDPFTIGSTDSDGDGIADDLDNCPDLANADQANFDGDFYGDACDPDDDNDGVADGDDAFPFNQAESRDTDGDGIGDNADTDDDNDGQSDTDEVACGSDPKDASSYSPDNEGDGIPDCVDPDDDNDGTNDDIDNCPITANADQADSDCDEVGDVCDICPDGDDTVDANSDGIPDCSQLLGYADYSASWRRWRRKILICKRGRTLSVSNRSLPAHIRRGAWVGPCSSCRPWRRHAGAKIAQEEFDLVLYPNPASNQAIISFTLPETADISIQILDSKGIFIKQVMDGEAQAGKHELKVNTQYLAAGMYFYQVRIDGEVLSRPFIVRR